MNNLDKATEKKTSEIPCWKSSMLFHDTERVSDRNILGKNRIPRENNGEHE